MQPSWTQINKTHVEKKQHIMKGNQIDMVSKIRTHPHNIIYLVESRPGFVIQY